MTGGQLVQNGSKGEHDDIKGSSLCFTLSCWSCQKIFDMAYAARTICRRTLLGSGVHLYRNLWTAEVRGYLLLPEQRKRQARFRQPAIWKKPKVNGLKDKMEEAE